MRPAFEQQRADAAAGADGADQHALHAQVGRHRRRERAARPERVTQTRLRRQDPHVANADRGERGALDRVERRAVRACQHEVGTRLIAQRPAHRAHHAVGDWRATRQRRLESLAVPEHAGAQPGAARRGVGGALEYRDGGPLGRPHARRRIDERPCLFCRLEQTHVAQGLGERHVVGVGAAGEDHVGAPRADQIGGVAECAGTGSHPHVQSRVRPVNAERDRHLAGGGARHGVGEDARARGRGAVGDDLR